MTKSDTAAIKEIRSAELRAERLSAALRALIFLVLLAVFGSTTVDHDHTLYSALSLSLYGLVTVGARSEEHTSELQSLMRISYAVFCLKKTKHKKLVKEIQQESRTHSPY